MVDRCLNRARGRPAKAKLKAQSKISLIPSGENLTPQMSCHASTNFLPVSPSTACSHRQDSVTSGGSYFDHSSEFFTGPSVPCIDKFDTDFQFRDCSTPTFMPEPRSMPIIRPRCLSYNFTEPPTIPNTPSEINSELSVALSIHSHSRYENYRSSPRDNSDFQNETADESFQYATKSPCCNDGGCVDLRDTDSIPGQCSYPTSPPDTQSASTSVQTNFHVSSNEIYCDSSTISTVTTSSQTTLNSSSILTELPSNPNPSFLLDMSNWRRDLTQFGTVHTGPNGETFLPPASFARLDSYLNELSQSEYPAQLRCLSCQRRIEINSF